MSSHTKSAVELDALLVEDTYGELTSRIFTILLRKGRLPVSSIQRHTQLSKRQVYHGLVVLIQQDLIYHYFDSASNVTQYEANHAAAYKLVKAGKVLDMIEGRYGAAARELASNLFQWGHTTVLELVQTYKSKEDKTTNGASNGKLTLNGSATQPDKVRSSEIHKILLQLLEDGLLETVDERNFKSPADTYNDVRAEVLRGNREGPKGQKEKDAADERIRSMLEEIRDGGPDWTPRGGKRKSTYADSHQVNGGGKKRKLANGAINGSIGYVDETAELDPQLTLRINYEKCSVVLRNLALVDLVKIRLGETQSQVYEAVLRALEPQIARCRLDPKIDIDPKEDYRKRVKDEEKRVALAKKKDPSLEGFDHREVLMDYSSWPQVTTKQLLAQLNPNLDLGGGIGKIPRIDDGINGHEKPRSKSKHTDDASQVNGKSRNGRDENSSDDEGGAVARPVKRSRVTFEDEIRQPDYPENTGTSRLVQLKSHLQLLSADRCGLLTKLNSNDDGTWTIDFEVLTEYIKNSELDKMIWENHGQMGHRLVRMLRSIGRLEEKAIPGVALMKPADIRTKLAEMQMAGIVDIQEVPRDAQHTIPRTIFLWYFDTERVGQIYLDKLYKCLTRTFQRLDVEKVKAKDVLATTQRQDVRGQKPEEYLDPESLRDLQAFQDIENDLLTQAGRLDDLISIFQDY